MDWGSGITYLAQTKFKGKMTPFGIKDVDRFQHVCFLGRQTTTTALLAHMAIQDIARGVGTVILDATGNLAQLVSERIDQTAVKRLIFLDPYDSENPFSWNAVDEFRSLPPQDAAQCLSETLASLYRIPESPLTSIAAGLMLANKDATVLLLYELVTDQALRTASLSEDARTKFESLLVEEKDSVEIIHDQGRYLAKDLLVRNLLGQHQSKMSLAPIPEGGILVLDVSKIRVFPTRITPLVRLFLHVVRAQARRRNQPVTIFLNECTKYLASADVAQLCAEPTLAISFTSSVHGEEDVSGRDELLRRTGSFFSSAIVEEDVPAIERIFYPYIAPEEIAALPEGEVAALLTIDSARTKPFLASVLSLPSHQGTSPHDLLILSRGRYATPRVVVEESLRKKPETADSDTKDHGDDSGSFSNAFRSIFAKSAAGPQSSKTPPAASSVASVQSKAPPVAARIKQSEIAEDELRRMLYVEPVAT